MSSPYTVTSSQDHVHDPTWKLRFLTAEEGLLTQAWLFYFALALFPFWWVGAFWRVPKTRVVCGALVDSQIEFDARSWRFRCRVMAAISLFTHIPLITFVAIFGSR